MSMVVKLNPYIGGDYGYFKKFDLIDVIKMVPKPGFEPGQAYTH